MLAADQIDIDYGKIALAKSKDKTVRKFAQRMVTDHSAVQKSMIALAEKLDVKGEDSPLLQQPEIWQVDFTSLLLLSNFDVSRR